jgi:hypothetical protein
MAAGVADWRKQAGNEPDELLLAECRLAAPPERHGPRPSHLVEGCKSFAHIPRRCTAPTARWPIVRDNPNIHLSESIVRPVARVCRLRGMLGVDGSVCSPQRPHAPHFSEGPDHCVTSHFTSLTPHGSIRLRFGVRSSPASSSTAATPFLRGTCGQDRPFIAEFNATMAKPSRWTIAAKPSG